MRQAKKRVFSVFIVLVLLLGSQSILSVKKIPNIGFIRKLGAVLTLEVAFALEPDRNSGRNYQPGSNNATTVKRQADSRWVIYDRGDKTDWLYVASPDEENVQLITTFEFLQVHGNIVIEVYGDDPFASFLEQRIVTEPQLYSYVSETLSEHSFKIYAEGVGASAQYSFVYTLSPIPTPEPTANLTPTPVSTATPTETPTVSSALSPMPTARPISTPSPTATSTPTSIPTVTPTPTAMPTLTPSPTATSSPIPISTQIPAISTPTPRPTLTPTSAVTLISTAVPTPTISSPLLTSPTAAPTLSLSPTPKESSHSSDSSLNSRQVVRAPSFFTVFPFNNVSVIYLGLLIGLGVCLLIIVILVIILVIFKHRLAVLSTPANDTIRAAEYKMLGDFAAEQDKLQLAERCYRKAVTLEPQDLHIHYELGVFLFQTKRYREATTEFTIYLRNEIVVSEVYDYLGYSYLMLENWVKAEEHYQKFLEFAPDDPDGYFGLGVIAQSRKQYTRAYDYYAKALEIQPDFPEARQHLDQIQQYLSSE